MELSTARCDNMDSTWNPWHGCRKYAAGCLHCYVYRRDGSVGRDASQVRKTASFDLGVRKDKSGAYVLPPGSDVWVCMTSDFFLEDADGWRGELWDMLRIRRDLRFRIITKRIVRAKECLPADWGDGWTHIAWGCTAEDMTAVRTRLPVFLSTPLRNRFIVCEPLLEPLDLTPFLTSQISTVVVGGESGDDARVCDLAWARGIREQCVRARVPFHFKQTGAHFCMDGVIRNVPRREQFALARELLPDYRPHA